jgi:hypothetical protein
MRYQFTCPDCGLEQEATVTDESRVQRIPGGGIVACQGCGEPSTFALPEGAFWGENGGGLVVPIDTLIAMLKAQQESS